MAFGQLTYRESLRDIGAYLRAQQSKLTTWASAVKFRVPIWRTPTGNATGGFTPTSRTR